MKKIFTVEDYRNLMREYYQEERSPMVKGFWLKVGVSINELLEQNKYLLIDEATEKFEEDLLALINMKSEK